MERIREQIIEKFENGDTLMRICYKLHREDYANTRRVFLSLVDRGMFIEHEHILTVSSTYSFALPEDLVKIRLDNK